MGISSFKEIDDMVAKATAGAKNILFTPWLFGERSPLNDPYLRGQFFNLSMDHKREDLFRAVFEGVAFNLKWGLDIVEKLSRGKENEIRLIGGASNSNEWCQIFSDVFQKKCTTNEKPPIGFGNGCCMYCFCRIGNIS